MFDRPKGNFSFLIAFAKQLAEARATDRDDDVGLYLASIVADLDVLLSRDSVDAGEDDSGLPDGDEDVDASGDGDEVGAPRTRGFPRSTPAPVDQPEQRVAKLGPTDAGRLYVDSRVAQPSFLTPSRGQGRKAAARSTKRRAVKRGKK